MRYDTKCTNAVLGKKLTSNKHMKYDYNLMSKTTYTKYCM